MPAVYRYIAGYDIETTGFSHTRDEIIQLAAVRFNVFTGERQYFAAYIKPSKPVNPRITKLTGITNKTLAVKGLDLKTAVHCWKLFLYGGGSSTVMCMGEDIKPLLVGHNCINFDNKFLVPKLKQYKLPLFFADTMLIMRAEVAGVRARNFKAMQAAGKKVRPAGQKYNLPAACAYYNVKQGRHHSALADSEAALDIFLNQVNKHKWKVTKK